MAADQLPSKYLQSTKKEPTIDYMLARTQITLSLHQLIVYFGILFSYNESSHLQVLALIHTAKVYISVIVIIRFRRSAHYFIFNYSLFEICRCLFVFE